MKLTIVSNNSVSKEVFLEDRKVDIYDFGDIVKSDISSKEEKISQMNFVSREADDETLEKYNLDLGLYGRICRKLEEEIQSILF